MELQFLGTGAGVPATSRNVTSIALKLLDECNEIWLFDCGEGTQQQILKTHIRPRKINKIFITHLHGDHIFGLPGLLSSRSFQGGDENLVIYGPKGIKKFVETTLKISESRLSYKISYVELDAFEGVKTIIDNKKFKVEVALLDHRIHSFGYRIIEKDLPGELLIDKVKAANIPQGPVYSQLKKGEIVTLEDGRTFDGKDFIGQPKKGRIVTILGDTRKTPNVEILAKDADVLVHESTFGKDEQKLAANYYHSTSTQAATVAKNANVKRLFLTHISARYVGKLAYQLQKEARSIFKNTKIAWDFDVFEIPSIKETNKKEGDKK
ncbi:ribonuclease Z [Catellicoccus marimammalium]|uniref:Ribonuclease Z n=1 Tax=Catellicoccus marimammalium M35/04/3 TaxID=1234409 RepID=K8ZKZ4_9ENTE|nr:ribonuclease Z [Catellicoccus marimammalium]EKU27253.1 Ribonuclease Z [Catellicoccus marimammalium M35/04/3]